MSEDSPGFLVAPRYSPERRTALVFTGTGTDGAYHAGVLRALNEVGVKIDIVCGRGVGVIAALFAAVDGGERLWAEKGFWHPAGVRRFYPWKASLRFAVTAMAAAMAIVLVPILLAAAGLIVFPIDFFFKIIGLSTGAGLVGRYLDLATWLFAPSGLPTWLPRFALLVLGVAAAALCGQAWLAAGTRRRRGAFWWRLVPAPISNGAPVRRFWATLWDLIRGAAALAQPSDVELGRRYTEMAGENIGQPGFRELLLTAHDVDAHRDVIGALVHPSRREQLFRRATTQEADARRAEIFDLAGVGRDYLAHLIAGALTLPVAGDLHAVAFASDAYWRGETHRLGDRQAALGRIFEELIGLDVEQVLLVSAAPEAGGPHALEPARVDGRGRLGEYLRSCEAAIARDTVRAHADGSLRVFTILASYNPIGPLDFAGGYDDRSDRPQPLAELLARGYEDTYHQFIDPVVAASGERVGAGNGQG